MSFWEKTLGGSALPTGTPALPRAWWDVPTGRTAPPVTEAPVTGQVLSPSQGSHITTKAPSSKRTDLCPSCGSGNYTGGVGGDMNAGARCFECGYNGRFDQQAYTTTGGASVTATKQTASGHQGYSGAIIGKA